MKGIASHGRRFSAFAITLGLAIFFGFLNFLREPPMGDFHGEWFSLILFCCAAFFIAPAFPARFQINRALFALPVSLSLLLAVQTMLGVYSAWQTPAFWFGYLLAATLTMLLGQGIRAVGLTSEVVNRIAWALAIVALLNTLAQLVQVVWRVRDVSPFVVGLVNCRPYGNIGQSNHAAMLAWLGLGSVLYLRGLHRLPAAAAVSAIAFLLLGSALTASRMSWLLLGLTAAVVLMMPAWPGGDRRSRWMTAGMLVTGFVVATIATMDVLHALGPHCVSGVDRLNVRGDHSIGLRLELWKQAFAVWWSSPWLGVGAYGFGPAVYALLALEAPTGIDTYAHNLPLQLLAEFGIIGAGAAVLFAALSLRWFVRARTQLTAADALLLLMVGGVLVHSMLEYPLWHMHFLLPFCLMLGLLFRPEWSRWPLALSLRAPVAAIAGCMLVICGLLFHDYRALDRLTWIELYRHGMRVAPTAEVRTQITEALADVRLFRVRAEMIAIGTEPLQIHDLQRQIRDVDGLMRGTVFAPLIVRRIALAILDNDPQGARWHLHRMLWFRMGESEQLTESLYRLVRQQPKEFAALKPMLDEELARLPKPRR